MPLCYSYLRMSNADQLKGDSLRRQLEASRVYAAENGLTLDESMRDLGVSAYRGKNRESGALARLVDLVKTGDIPAGSYLIIESLDRLSRETPYVAMGPFIDLIKAGVRIVTLCDRKVYDSESLEREPLGLLTSIIIMMRANEESKIKSERVGAAWRQKHENANEQKVSERSPAWLRLTSDRKSFVVREAEAETIRSVFEMTAAGIGRQALARILNKKGKSPSGGRWYASSIARLLNSDTVLGVYQPFAVKAGVRTPRGEPIPGYYPRIVEPPLVQRARAAMAERRLGFAGRRGNAHVNLFPQRLYCGICGARMRIRYAGKNWRGNPVLKCGNIVDCVDEWQPNSLLDRFPGLRDNLDLAETHRQSFNYYEFEGAMLDRVHEIDLSPILLKQDASVISIESEMATAAQQLSAKRQILDRFIAQFEKEDPEKIAAIANRMRALSAEIDSSELRLNELRLELTKATVQGISAEERLSSIQKLALRMSGATGDDLYKLRAQLSQEISRVVSRVTFNAVPELALTNVGVVVPRDRPLWGRITIKTPGGDRDRYEMARDANGFVLCEIPDHPAAAERQSDPSDETDSEALAELRVMLAKLDRKHPRIRQ